MEKDPYDHNNLNNNLNINDINHFIEDVDNPEDTKKLDTNRKIEAASSYYENNTKTETKIPNLLNLKSKKNMLIKSKLFCY